ncbi:hypothetical protein JB92DRAFT_2907575 [Gautieria morchelliformis]|nr:hypothetical protein JB92DRAFT_2907575 [Gautieria morchelliformis]
MGVTYMTRETRTVVFILGTFCRCVARLATCLFYVRPSYKLAPSHTSQYRYQRAIDLGNVRARTDKDIVISRGQVP